MAELNEAHAGRRFCPIVINQNGLNQARIVETEQFRAAHAGEATQHAGDQIGPVPAGAEQDQRLGVAVRVQAIRGAVKRFHL